MDTWRRANTKGYETFNVIPSVRGPEIIVVAGNVINYVDTCQDLGAQY